MVVVQEDLEKAPVYGPFATHRVTEFLLKLYQPVLCFFYRELSIFGMLANLSSHFLKFQDMQ